jgi:hypothetical protein
MRKKIKTKLKGSRKLQAQKTAQRRKKTNITKEKEDER